MDRVKKFVNLPFKYHLVVGTFIRLLLIFYADFHDNTYDVPYTDVDYKVFTDASRHMLAGNSPYKRHTYRYSPIVAYLLIPNIVVGKDFGKLLFSMFDVLVTIAIKVLVEHQLKLTNIKNPMVSTIPIYCSLFWLYNPMSIGISTRGNADSVPCFFIVLSILYMQTNLVRGLTKYLLAGILLGVSIHLRLYPLAFTFPMYLSLGEYKISRNTSIKNGLSSLIPNRKQIILALSCITTLFLFTFGMYLLYGYEFLFETYIFHLFRKDTKHNFSIHFYYSYLTIDQLGFDIVKLISQIFEFILLFVVSLAFGCDACTMPFSLFSQAFVLVAFNSVMTSQYFIWFLSLLPLVVHDFKMTLSKALVLTTIWLSTQAAWLFYAYLLEFKCEEMFLHIWLASVLFFCANIFVLGELITSYTPGFELGQKDLIAKTK